MPLAARVLLALLAAALLLAAVVAWRAYRAERAALAIVRRAVPPPGGPELAALEPIELPGPDGALRAWYLPPRNGALVLLLHGLGGDRAEVVPQARALARRGYGVLLPDLPGHGESGGRIAGGAPETMALERLVGLARVRDAGTRLGVFGFSYGACLALELAARDPGLQALALEGAPSDLEAQLAYEYRAWGLPALAGARLALRQAGFDLRGCRPRDAIVRLAQRPLLLIAGAEDEAVPPSMARELHEAAAGSELWVVPGASHLDVFAREPAEYERRLLAFFDRHLR